MAKAKPAKTQQVQAPHEVSAAQPQMPSDISIRTNVRAGCVPWNALHKGLTSLGSAAGITGLGLKLAGK